MAHMQSEIKKKFYKKNWFKITTVIVVIVVLTGGVFAWKTGSILNKISGGGLFSSLIHNIPGVKNELKGEADGRINILLLGMRGENVPGGGLLADTIMVASLKPGENKASLISIPRDLYVDNPIRGAKTKINDIYAAGEDNGKKEGLEEMEKAVETVTGLPIHYGASINFAGFKQLVDAIGGIEITLEEPFEEPIQFNEPHVCDDTVFTIPTGKFEIKKRNGKVTAEYPLCTNPDTECGGDFKLPTGTQTLDGEQALCYVRSRVTSSDFERAKRQQIVLQLVKDKMLSVGTLTDFSKINSMLDVLGNNARTDMQMWELQRFYEIYKKIPDAQMYQRVLENSKEGLLYNPTDMPAEVGYILLPIGNNYDQIHEMAKNIFNLPEQSDIKPDSK